MFGHSSTPENAALHLDTLVREDIISLAPNPEIAKLMQALPTRQLLYYCFAVRLASTLKHAQKNSLHYAQLLEKTPGPEALASIIAELGKIADLSLRGTSKSYALMEMQFDAILSALPFTWPDDLLKNPESFLAVSHSEVESVISQESSGTTGKPENKYKRVFCTQRDQEATIAFFAAGMRYLVSGQDKVAMLLSAGGTGSGNLAELFGAAMQRIGVPFMTASKPFDEALTMSELDEFKPTCIISTPRQFLSLLRDDCKASPEAKERLARVKAGLKNVLFSGDRVSSALSGIIKRELGIGVFLHYGMVESGIGTAVECSQKRGAHYRESDFFIEIITPDGVSHPCPQSSRSTVYIDPNDLENGCIYGPTPWGEVTITSLSREGTPLIRYRTGDSGRIVVDKCACGSTLWRLDVRGRMDDFIELPLEAGKNALNPPYIEYTAFDSALYELAWVKDYQLNVHVDKNGMARQLCIMVLLGGLAPANDKDALWAIGQELAYIEARAAAHGVSTHIRLLRDRQEFCSLFSYSPKRIFPRSTEPLDLSGCVS